MLYLSPFVRMNMLQGGSLLIFICFADMLCSVTTSCLYALEARSCILYTIYYIAIKGINNLSFDNASTPTLLIVLIKYQWYIDQL